MRVWYCRKFTVSWLLVHHFCVMNKWYHLRFNLYYSSCWIFNNFFRFLIVAHFGRISSSENSWNELFVDVVRMLLEIRGFVKLWFAPIWFFDFRFDSPSPMSSHLVRRTTCPVTRKCSTTTHCTAARENPSSTSTLQSGTRQTSAWRNKKPSTLFISENTKTLTYWRAFYDRARLSVSW